MVQQNGKGLRPKFVSRQKKRKHGKALGGSFCKILFTVMLFLSLAFQAFVDVVVVLVAIPESLLVAPTLSLAYLTPI